MFAIYEYIKRIEFFATGIKFSFFFAITRIGKLDAHISLSTNQKYTTIGQYSFKL